MTERSCEPSVLYAGVAQRQWWPEEQSNDDPEFLLSACISPYEHMNRCFIHQALSGGLRLDVIVHRP
ncbi:MAG: hypothetical protein KDE46_11060, partial [Caldilineaceae bacterium]|nr:hypothetical protein [Caldilineaceae bacterium]